MHVCMYVCVCACVFVHVYVVCLMCVCVLYVCVLLCGMVVSVSTNNSLQRGMDLNEVALL